MGYFASVLKENPADAGSMFLRNVWNTAHFKHVTDTKNQQHNNRQNLKTAYFSAPKTHLKIAAYFWPLWRLWSLLIMSKISNHEWSSNIYIQMRSFVTFIITCYIVTNQQCYQRRNVKVHMSVHNMETYEEVEVHLQLFLNTSLNDGESSASPQ
jgi:hypothetical protein